MRRSRTRRAAASIAVLIALVGVGGGCAGPGSTQHDQVGAADPAPDPSEADLWLSFDEITVGRDGATAYPDALGRPYAGRVVPARQGSVQRAPGADGSGGSIAFPGKCTAPGGCPRAMVEVATTPALDPGADDFEYGATVWLEPDQTTTGSNIMQQGRFATDGGQWKLQVDTEAGEPSCVVRSGAEAVVVRSRVSIADGAWHRVWCRRDGGGVSIWVDGIEDRAEGRTGSVSNAWPIRLGSPGVGQHDDQFHGRIDDAFLLIDG